MALAVLVFGAVAMPSGQADADTPSAVSYLPHVASRGYTTGLTSAVLPRVAPGSRLDGIVGWGESTIELQSMVSSDSSCEIELGSFVFDPVATSRNIPAGGSRTVALKHVEGITASTYTASIAGQGPIGVVARTTWDGGGATAYQAPEIGDELVLPLAMRDIYTHTSLLQVVNTDEDADNDVIMRSYLLDGAVRSEWEFTLWPGETGRIDPSYEAEFAGLSMEALWFTAEAPLAIMALGDEFDGRGVSSLRARPASAGSDRQWLPFVRANMGGDTLIAVANAKAGPVDATITYRGSSGSPSGAGKEYQQRVQIGPRSAVFVDLDGRKRRGNTEPPADLPRGARAGQGFFGSVTITGSGPLLAAAWEQSTTRYITNVMTSAAYNAFGPDDLSTAFAVPHVRYSSDGHTSQLVLMNPGSGAADVSIDVIDDAGDARGLPAVSLGGGEMTVVPVVLPAPGSGQALVDASAPIAVLVYDIGAETDLTAYWAIKMPADLIDLPTRTPTSTPVPPTETPTPGPGTPTSTSIRLTATPSGGSRVFLPVACSSCR
jgi:hypothetical protein